jgi:hypothetical protein
MCLECILTSVDTVKFRDRGLDPEGWRREEEKGREKAGVAKTLQGSGVVGEGRS